jgi:sarcosine oxidase subunit alpha
MPETLTLHIDDRAVRVTEGTSVAAAILTSGGICRTSVQGQPRSAVCGMGICFECRATVNGLAQQRTCQIICREGMRVMTHA